MYRIVHGNAPQYLKRGFSMVNDQHFFSPEIVSVVLYGNFVFRSRLTGKYVQHKNVKNVHIKKPK